MCILFIMILNVLGKYQFYRLWYLFKNYKIQVDVFLLILVKTLEVRIERN